ncbi:hypothetical protein J6590_083505 [Homalodisca vitripennis]|nr:hypothetical protein J6590_083505 [Homalodisca vitripennis]
MGHLVSRELRYHVGRSGVNLNPEFNNAWMLADSEDTPTGGEKTPEPAKPPPGRPPFKVCFKLARVRGRSDISPCHHRGFVHAVTGKFYSIRESSCQQEPDVEAVNRAYSLGPRQLFHSPRLESHRYGWHHDVTFVDSDILNDRRLNFFNRTAPMFRTPTIITKK